MQIWKTQTFSYINIKKIQKKKELRKKELAYYTEKSKNIKVDKDAQDKIDRRFGLYDKNSSWLFTTSKYNLFLVKLLIKNASCVAAVIVFYSECLES